MKNEIDFFHKLQEVQVMEGGQEVTYAYTSDNNTVTVIGDPSSVSGHHEIQLDPNSSSQAQQIFQVSNNAGSATTDRSQKASTPFTPVNLKKTQLYLII